MDLGLAGKTAIVCASSQGLGRACAESLAIAGVSLVLNGRNAEALDETAAAIRDAHGVTVETVAGDVGDAGVQAALVAAAKDAPDILVNNNGGPPPRGFRDLDRAALHAGLDANMVVPIEMVQRVIDGMIARQFGRIVNITSGSVKSSIPGLELSSGARIGLHGFLAGVSRDVAASNVTINFLLPGSFATGRLTKIMGFVAQQQGVERGAVEDKGRAAIPARRFGDPAEFGDACAFLCAAQAGYITGQSLLIDGGQFPGVI